jgi:hypothetical protein
MAQQLPSTFSVATPSPAATHSHPGVTTSSVRLITPLSPNSLTNNVGIFFMPDNHTLSISAFARFGFRTVLPYAHYLTSPVSIKSQIVQSFFASPDFLDIR